ncbi:MAG: hypothetical protein R3B13_32975 [Polyangiaceae bacterium]
MNDPATSDLDPLAAIQAELEAQDALLAELWDALEARGCDPIPVDERELGDIEEHCRIERVSAHPNQATTCGLRC